jgi:hypothetical protein
MQRETVSGHCRKGHTTYQPYDTLHWARWIFESDVEGVSVDDGAKLRVPGKTASNLEKATVGRG